MNFLIKYILSFFLIIIFIGCENNTPSYNYVSEPSHIDENRDNYNPIVLPEKTSFMEDIETLQIAAIGESQSSARNNRKLAPDSEDNAEDDKDDSEDDGKDETSDDDDDEDDDGDSGEDDDDDDDEDEDTDDEKPKTVKEPELLDFTRIGGVKVGLNAKEYDFTIAVDNTAARLFPPSYRQNSDTTYTITIYGYILEDDDLRKEDGIFTLSFIVPRLGGRSTVVLTPDSNILTNSSKEGMDVRANVTITKSDDIFGVNLVSENFKVENRYKTRSFDAYISLAFELNKKKK